jgi:hypothetical protein
MVRTMVLVVGLSAALLASDASRAQDLIAAQMYGSGVHRYFSGDLRGAQADFNAAIQGGAEDPRPYYFRGLTYLRSGWQSAALADFQRGAQLEAADINGSYEVSQALRRVQGQPRLQLERYRVQARAIAQQRQQQQRRERYAAARRFESERVQRASATEDPARTRGAPPRPPVSQFDDASPAPAEALAPFGGAPPADRQPDARDDRPADLFAPPPGDAPPGDAASPFGAPPPAAERSDDAAAPFGAPPAAPFGAPPPAAQPAEAPAETTAEPFGAPAAEVEAPPAPANGSPFGAPTTPVDDAAPTAPGVEPADPASPFGNAAGETNAAGADDSANGAGTTTNPFGDTATPADAPASDATNPFEAPPAAGDNPAIDTTPNGAATPADGSNPPVAPNSTSSNAGAGTGLFRALRRAVGVDAALGAAESAARALPIGQPAGMGARPNATSSSSTVPLGGPPAAGAMQPEPLPGQGASPFGNSSIDRAGAASSESPFGASAGEGPQAVDPFNPPARAPQEAAPPGAAPTGDDPFRDDPVQPGAPAASPFDAAR